jgi:hypothetical protein
MQLLRAFGFAIGIEGDAVFRPVFQPVFEREAITLGLGNLLALLDRKSVV